MVTPFNSTVPVNELINCRGEGLAVGGAYQAGFNFPRAKVIGASAPMTQAFSNGGDGEVLFTITTEDNSSLYDPATGRMWAKVRGVYLLETGLEYLAQAGAKQSS